MTVIEPLFTVKLQRPTEYPFTTHPTSVLALYEAQKRGWIEP